ncbi:MAG TPA: lysylphosphatidylglycerol synthase transmembrane domain-containing protein [Polyangiaceae bacterium]|jgi:hypothetical protein|nr:lysylphosphatidylglycerol synthase transmembrane domain-containing protein [Polyangiaceae bacterium]HNZ23366.1 lysylphosphatidylglycerol synthase transmembrane domain-containing protein [Polyangiaceae bacterium]HOE50188.1 lysylphosphatidylglycerol synthase transmembrane domain-containing protein [Polyangiaceae bacterium]HOH03315.1 lysylphosphatidylglycerol synthase transmembrane domain-containing protein [Polyangiaceae bacterium]HOR37647.1 lysylphosphatidylglycerol synthase transmembrane dom
MNDKSEGAPRRDIVRSPRPWAGFATSIVLSIAILLWLWHRHALVWTSLKTRWATADHALLVAVFGGSAAFHIAAGAFKLHRVLRSMGVDIRWNETLRVRLGAGPVRAFLPFSTGEIIHVLYFRARKRMTVADTSGIMIFDKSMNLIGSLWWLALGIFLASEPRIQLGILRQASSVPVALIAALLAVSFIIVFIPSIHRHVADAAMIIHPRVGEIVSGMLSPFRQLHTVQKIELLIYGVVFQLRPIVVCFFLLRSLAVPVRWVDTLLAASAAVCAGYLPGFVVGSGPRETVLVEAFGAAYGPVEAIFLGGLLMTFAVNVFPALLGLPWTVWFLRRLRRSDVTGRKG